MMLMNDPLFWTTFILILSPQLLHSYGCCVAAGGGRREGSSVAGHRQRSGSPTGGGPQCCAQQRDTTGRTETQGERTTYNSHQVGNASPCKHAQKTQWMFQNWVLIRYRSIAMHVGSNNIWFACVFSLQNRVQESLEDGVRLPSLDIEKLREENTTLKDEQQRLKKVFIEISFLKDLNNCSNT